MKKILVCLDYSEITDSVIEGACNFAAPLNAEIHLAYVSSVHAEKVTHVVSSENQKKVSVAKMKENSRMDSYESVVRQKGISCSSDVLSGHIGEVLADKAIELDVDFIIIGSRTTSAANHVIKGSVGADLLKKTKKPVLLIPQS